jgi:hypothetical protein
VYDAAPNARIDVVRGRLSDERAEQILRFWDEHGALDESTARERLQEVVCVLEDDSGALVGVNSVFDAEVPLVGDRRFWVYRSFVLPQATDAAPAMVHTATRALEVDFDPSVEGPVGVFLSLLPGEISPSREAMWLWPPSTYAGRLEDGREGRIKYFWGALIGPPRRLIDFGSALDRDYTVHLFGDQSPVDAEAVIDLWTSEGAVPADEARRRVGEVAVVATYGDSVEPVGIATVFLRRNAQLGMNMWHFRMFVGPEHRLTRVGFGLIMAARAELERRFVSGEDPRGAGMLIELENRSLMHRLDDSFWPPGSFTFIGENERGDHIRVSYFQGATVPRTIG